MPPKATSRAEFEVNMMQARSSRFVNSRCGRCVRKSSAILLTPGAPTDRAATDCSRVCFEIVGISATATSCPELSLSRSLDSDSTCQRHSVRPWICSLTSTEAISSSCGTPVKSGILIQYLKTPKLDGAPSCRERGAAPMRFFRFLPQKGAKFPEKGNRNSYRVFGLWKEPDRLFD